MRTKPNRDTPHSSFLSLYIIITDTLPDKEVDLKTEAEPEEVMEDKNDLFVSAMDSPSDSGLETNKTSQSDTMEDLSLQVSQRFGRERNLETLSCRMIRSRNPLPPRISTWKRRISGYLKLTSMMTTMKTSSSQH